MLDQIRQEQAAMEAAIPTWEWGPEFDEIHSRLSKEKTKILYGGEESGI